MKRLMSWSGGKDSAWALHIIRRDSRYDLKGLVTTVNSESRRVAIHCFRTKLLELQADPLVAIPANSAVG
jgi:diphthamide synthase (EF-2-diphthine--ammonia ligase)